VRLALCDQPGHDFVGNYSYDYEHRNETGEWRMRLDKDEPNVNHQDHATHRVAILAPVSAIEVNAQHEFCCVGCAGKMAEAYIGFGWDVEVKDITRGQEVTT
jgi:hypothetical protein